MKNQKLKPKEKQNGKNEKKGFPKLDQISSEEEILLPSKCDLASEITQ